MRLRDLLPLPALLACCSPPPPSGAEDAAVFAERTVVFLLADSIRIETLRAEVAEEEFHGVMDDMMWYRAEAWRWFEEHGIPVVSFDGRPRAG
ncbi:MAG TPA: hypothetical protein VMN78_12370 [Longimicrobiales bacterium]|nr:hypothetical protein [Longimicrobiales bacterium]